MGRGRVINDAPARTLIRPGYVVITDKHGTDWIINQDRIYFIEIPGNNDFMFTVHGFGKSIVLEFAEQDECAHALAEIISPPSLPSADFVCSQ